MDVGKLELPAKKYGGDYDPVNKKGTEIHLAPRMFSGFFRGTLDDLSQNVKF